MPPLDEDRKLRRRLQSDLKQFTRLFARYDVIPLQLIDEEVKPIVRIIALLDIDDISASFMQVQGGLGLGLGLGLSDDDKDAICFLIVYSSSSSSSSSSHYQPLILAF